MARQCHRQEERLRLRQRGRKGRPPCRPDSHGLELFGETEKAAGEATDGNGRKNGTRCDGKCSALQWATQRAEMTDAACCIFQSTFPGNPEQSAFISSPTYSSIQINHPPSPSSTLFSAPASPRFLPHQHVLRPHETHTPSTASTFVFLCLHAHFPQPAHSSSTASTLVFHYKKHLSSSTRALTTTQPEHSPSPANTIVFHNQNVRLPLPTRPSPPASALGFSCQNPRNPQPTESYSQPTGSPASIQAARAAR